MKNRQKEGKDRRKEKPMERQKDRKRKKLYKV